MTLLAGVAWIALGEPDSPTSGAPASADVRPGAQLASPASGSLEAGVQLPSSRAALVLTADATAEVEIRDATSMPLAMAPWAIFRGEEVLAFGTTAQDGLARFPRGTAMGGLAVLPPGRPVQQFALDLAARRQVVALPACASVAGWATVDGLAPLEPVTLVLRVDESRMRDLPSGALEALGEDVSTLARFLSPTGPDGSFRFDGLPLDWSGTLSWYRNRCQRRRSWRTSWPWRHRPRICGSRSPPAPRSAAPSSIP